MATKAISVQASNPRPSQFTQQPDEDFPRGVLVGAVDVDVVVTFPANEDEPELRIEGEVTLARNEADGVTLEAFGSPDNWISGALHAAMRARTRAEEGITRDMYDTLVAEAAAVGQQVR